MKNAVGVLIVVILALGGWLVYEVISGDFISASQRLVIQKLSYLMPI